MSNDPPPTPKAPVVDEPESDLPSTKIVPSDLSTLLAPESTQPAHPSAPSRPAQLPSAARAERPSPHDAYMAQRYYGALDGLRAVGILAVIWHHTMGGPGRFGANLFFLLSGFLITTILVRERAKKGAIDVRRFRTRRARRLYPLYFTVLAGYVALVWLIEPAGVSRSAFFANLPAFATFTSNLFVGLEGEHVIFYFAWSLAAQEQFYLFWPAYLRHLSLRTCAGALVSLLATVYLTRAGVFDLALPPGSVVRTAVLSLLPAILLGSLLGMALNARQSFRLLHRLFGSRWASSALLALSLLLWRMPQVPEPFLHVALASLAAACVIREDHVLARLLKRPILVHIGTVSYGIYLLHMLCHNAVERALTSVGTHVDLLDFALTSVAVVGVATLSHRYFEDKFLPRDKRRKTA